MSGLSNYQLLLLDNLIYLDSCVTDKGVIVKDIIYTLLYKDDIHYKQRISTGHWRMSIA